MKIIDERLASLRERPIEFLQATRRHRLACSSRQSAIDLKSINSFISSAKIRNFECGRRRIDIQGKTRRHLKELQMLREK